ncbi:hypothetical protein KM043_001159 [Ampulex compressa]|nr:hypothetical protein KM043_001159 [Ampulex compressa]
MDNSRNKRTTKKKVDALVEEIENGEEELSAKRQKVVSETSLEGDSLCPCRNLAANSSRFSLRLLEAMRSLRQEDDPLCTSSAQEIVDRLQADYHSDGDLYAQVRTSLKQVCSQGFVMELLDNEYHLIGPLANSMNRVHHPAPQETSSTSTSVSTYSNSPSQTHQTTTKCTCEKRSINESPSKNTNHKSPNPSTTFNTPEKRTHARGVKKNLTSKDTFNPQSSSTENHRECSCRNPRKRAQNRRSMSKSRFKDCLAEEDLPQGRSKRSKMALSRAISQSSRIIDGDGVKMGSQVCGEDFRGCDGRGVGGETQGRVEGSSEEEESVALGSGDGQEDLGEEFESEERLDRSRKRDWELRRWIRRCQRECQRRMGR